LARKTNYSFEKRRKELDKKKKKEAKLQRKLDKKNAGEGPPIAEFDNGLDPAPEVETDETTDVEESTD
jgi:hypothetical protein